MLKNSKSSREVELHNNPAEENLCIIFVIKRGQHGPMSFVANPVQLLLLKPFCFFLLVNFMKFLLQFLPLIQTGKISYVVLLTDGDSVDVYVVGGGVQFNLIFVTVFIHNYEIKALSPF